MNIEGAIGGVIAVSAMIAALFLIVFGAAQDQATLITVGVGILSSGFTAVIAKYFTDQGIKALNKQQNR